MRSSSPASVISQSELRLDIQVLHLGGVGLDKAVCIAAWFLFLTYCFSGPCSPLSPLIKQVGVQELKHIQSPYQEHSEQIE